MNVDRIVNQIDPNHKIPGDLIARFVYINSKMRVENNKTLSDLRFQTQPKFLWTGAFLPMVDSTVVEARLPMTALTRGRARKSMSRCILDSIWPGCSIRQFRRRMTGMSCGRIISGSTGIAS